MEKNKPEKKCTNTRKKFPVLILRCRVITPYTYYKVTGRRRDVVARMTREGAYYEWKVLYISATAAASYPRTTCSAPSITRVALEGGCLWPGVAGLELREGGRWFTESRGWRGPRVGRGGGRMGWTGLVPMVSPPVLTARTVAVVVCRGISFGGPSSEDGRADRTCTIVVEFVVFVLVFGIIHYPIELWTSTKYFRMHLNKKIIIIIFWTDVESSVRCCWWWWFRTRRLAPSLNPPWHIVANATCCCLRRPRPTDTRVQRLFRWVHFFKLFYYSSKN